MQLPHNCYRSAFQSSVNMKSSVPSFEKIPSRHQRKNSFGFLEQLHELLDTHSIGAITHRIASWSSDGFSFQIHKVHRFELLLIPLYFGNDRSPPHASGFESFLNQLRSYGFYRIETDNIYKNTFSHPLFVREKKNLIARMGL